MNAGTIFWFVVIVTLIGAAISAIGRTWLTLLVSYFVVGCVGSLVIYSGIEIYHLASEVNTIAEQYNSPFLRFLIEQVGMNEIAAILSFFSKDEREFIIFALTCVLTISLTLPFVTFANSIYSAITSGDATKAVEKSGSAIKDEIKALSEKQGELFAKMNEISSSLDAIKKTNKEASQNDKN